MTVHTRGSPPEETTSAPVHPQPPPPPPHAGPASEPSSENSPQHAAVTSVTTPIDIGQVERRKSSGGNMPETAITPGPPVSPSHSPSLPEDENAMDGSNNSVDVLISEDVSDDPDGGEVPTFPVSKLQLLDEQLSRQRWVVPVLPNQELHVLIDTAIKLCKKKLDVVDEACQRFYKDSLLLSFTRVMTDEAVKEWKQEILRHIYKLSERCLELCVLKLEDDSPPLMEILALLFNPKNKYYTVTQQRESDSMNEMCATKGAFAASPENGPPKGWLVDLLNKFGQLNGFQRILNRFQSGAEMNCTVICALLKPFGHCYEYLTPITVELYFQDPIRCAHRYMQNISDEELKRETKGDARESSPMEIVRYLRNLSTRVPGQDNIVRELELLRLKVILRILQTSSFAGKMNALNEISKILQSVSSSSSTYGPGTSDEYLNVQQVVSWIRDNDLLNVAIKENLHIIQYVEKLEKILRFMIKEKTLTITDLDQLWAAQIGKHDAIVKNVHDLLAKVAWDFTAEQLDHLFGCFQRSWTDAGKKQREKLLELIRRLAEDDRDGRCADKVLQLLWNFARSNDIPTDIMDQALQCHAKILDYSCSSQKETQKVTWLERCIEEIRQERWVLPAMKHFREICIQFPEGTGNNFANWSNSAMMFNRGRVVGGLQTSHSLVALIANSLVRYMETIRHLVKEHEQRAQQESSPSPPPSFSIDGHYDHTAQVHERLSFLKFILRDGHLWLVEQQAKEIWDTLVVNPVFCVDREAGFKWFVKMMGEMADLDPEIQHLFFEQRVLQLDPSSLTETGMRCFERFFKHVNQQENRLVINEQRHFHINNFDLVGQEYLWRVILSCNEDIANRAIELVREVYTNPSPDMIEGGKLVQLHTDFIQSCIDRLKASYDTLTVLCREKDSSNLINQETVRMTRVLRVLHGYIVSYDEQCDEDRENVPLYRASMGRTIDLLVSFTSQGKNQPIPPLQPLEVLTHSNETLGELKRQILQHLRMSTMGNSTGGPGQVLANRMRIDLLLNGDLLDSADDKKTLDDLGLYGRIDLQAKLHQSSRAGGGNGSSPGSSSGESSPGVGQSLDKMGNGECENLLPSTWLCHKHEQINFLLRIADLGTKLESGNLCECSREVLRAIPGDMELIAKITELTEQSPMEAAGTSSSTTTPQPTTITTTNTTIPPNPNSLQSVLFASSPSEVLYCLELINSMLAPSKDTLSEKTLAFHSDFVKAGGIQACLATLLQNNFLAQTDSATKATAFWFVLRLLRILLSVAIHVRCTAYTTALRSGQLTGPVGQATKIQCEYMTNFFNSMPSQLDTFCNRLCVASAARMEGVNVIPEENYPEVDHARMIIKLAWAAAGGNPTFAVASPDEIHGNCVKVRKTDLVPSHQIMCRDALEVFVLCVILNPTIMDSLLKEKFFQQCVIDLLFCPSDCVRVPSGEYFYYLATKTFAIQQRNLHFFITLLCTVLFSTATENSRYSREYFSLLRGLLMFANNAHVPFQQVDGLLDKEITWLKDARNYSMTNMEPYPDDALLEGHLMITRALVGFLPPDRKSFIGSASNGPVLVKQLLEDFLLPSSRMYVEQRSQTIQRSMTVLGNMDGKTSENRDAAGAVMMPRSLTTIYSPNRCVPVCATAQTVSVAYDLIVALCTSCLRNMQTVVQLLNEMYFDDMSFAVTEWEYAPPVNLRNASVFVGLKNGGATCYMNSVFQQLFMIEKLRDSVLTVASTNYTVDDSDTDEPVMQGPLIRRSPSSTPVGETTESYSSVEPTEKTSADKRKEYNMGVLQCTQLIFANLLGSQLQFYVPRKFWKHFRFGNELINLREQHDALEFFNSLVDSVDEALKAMSNEQMCNKVFGGMFADQKICKGCPHRYTREEPFTTLSLDVRNHHTMADSLQEYVKGDLLESENAYFCEKCNRKVDAVKRLCIKKLPPVLVIQLKRFDFDWEREQAVKFNDYFEFPREIDMEPYTVDGLAKLDGEVLTDVENNNEKPATKDEEKGDEKQETEKPKSPESPPEKVSTFYKLRGIIVHSGQASGGHYYSFILQRLPNGQQKWYKFDDGDVSECRMDDDEEMRTQCFGGEYTSEVFDSYLRRVQPRRHKRWWNAYILFYERADSAETDLAKSVESMTLSGRMRQIPPMLEDIVNRKNMKCCHRRNQYTLEFFQFIRQLCSCHFVVYRVGVTAAEDQMFQKLLLLSTELVSKFLFTTGLRAKRNLRGNPQDWTDLMSWLFRLCPVGRVWFASEILFKDTRRFAEYLLESPSPDVRLIFARILASLAHFGSRDMAASVQSASERFYLPQDTLSDLIVRLVLSLLQKEVSDFSRHLKEYFGFFHHYAGFGVEEKRQLLLFNVPSLFVRVVLDEGPAPHLKSISTELQKLYATVSVLIRSCDVSGVVVGSTTLCASADGSALRPNAWREPASGTPIMPIQPDLIDRLYEPSTKFLKKVLEDAIHLEDTVKLFKFLCWENIHFTKMVFSGLFYQVRCGFVEVRLLLECWLQVLLLEDSWVEKRVLLTLRGGEEQEGLFQFIQLQLTQQPRRSYLLVKMLVTVFDASPIALRVLYSHSELKRRWGEIVSWLHSEITTRRPYSSGYSYNSWTPPVVSNEVNTSGHFLERTKSAKITLSKIIQIAQNWPKDESEETTSEKQSDEETVSADVETEGEILGSVSAEVPLHPPPPYSPTPVPPPPPPRPMPGETEGLDPPTLPESALPEEEPQQQHDQQKTN